MIKNAHFPPLLNSEKQWKCWISLFLLHYGIANVFSEITVREYFPQTNDTIEINTFYSRPASGSWSADIPDIGIEGWILYAKPHNACGPVVPPPKSPVIKKPWILMARRYDCRFIDKAQYAQQAGYSAIIIHNVGSDSAMQMGGDDSFEINISAVSMGEFQAADLMNYGYNKDPRYTIKITNEMDISWLEKYLWPFFGVVTGCFCCMGIYILVKWALERRRMRRIASRRRLSTKQLNKIPTKKFKKGDAYEVCAICLEDYEENEKLRILPCNHAYHTKCVDPWLTKSRKFCPVCKRKILTKKEAEKLKKKTEQREREESQRRAEAERRQEQREEREEEEEDEEQAESSAVESSEEETEERDERDSGEAQPLIQDPPLTVVDRLRRFFRRRQTIEVEIVDDQSQPPLRDNHVRSGSRSSYGSMNNVDPVNSQIEAAESHLQQNTQHAGGLQASVGDTDRLRRHFQNHPDDLVRQIPTTVAVYATVHVEQHHPPQPEAGAASSSDTEVEQAQRNLVV